jgi:hypothetical protein
LASLILTKYADTHGHARVLDSDDGKTLPGLARPVENGDNASSRCHVLQRGGERGRRIISPVSAHPASHHQRRLRVGLGVVLAIGIAGSAVVWWRHQQATDARALRISVPAGGR